MLRRVLIAAAAIGAVVAAWIRSAAGTTPMPSFEQVRARWRPSDVRLLDRHGEPLYEMRIDRHGRRLTWTPVDEISPALVRAVIEAEDRRFFVHQGVDLRAIVGAMLRTAAGRRRRGASTIAMQLAAMLDPALGRNGHTRSPMQKLAQMRAAWELERGWSKGRILEAYLNLAAWRGELQGVTAASWVLFGKAPDGLTAAEATVMAAMLRAPNARRALIIRRARALRSTLAPDEPTPGEIAAAAGRALARHGGEFEPVALAPQVAQRLLGASDSDVRCTLDAALQRIVLETLRRHVTEVMDRGVDDGAVLVVDNRTGEVRAYAGSIGELSPAPWVDSVRAPRQPGSALKPFLYAYAIDRRLLTAASLLEDTPLELPEQRGLYRPLDYDRRFHGLVSVRTALASSLNVPAVRTAQLVGVDAFAGHLRALGFGGVVESGDFYGAALALGSADVTLWNLVNAYRTLADGGEWSPLQLTLGARPAGPRRLYSRAAAFIISNVLADRAARSETFGLENSLATRYWSAVKTGTSTDMRDNWCVGYTDRFTVGVWVGNVSGAPMHDVTGVTGAAPVWLEIMDYLRERYGGGAPAVPAGVIARPVVFPDVAEAARTEWFLDGTEPPMALSRLDPGAARITSPAAGAIIALDADIPPDQQRISFVADDRIAGARWFLDGRDVRCGTAAACMWQPRSGIHTLALVGTAGTILDRITFEVRGPKPSGAAPDAELSTASFFTPRRRADRIGAWAGTISRSR